MADLHYWLDRIARLAEQLNEAIENESKRGEIPEGYQESIFGAAHAFERWLQSYIDYVHERGFVTPELREAAYREVRPYRLRHLAPLSRDFGFVGSLELPFGIRKIAPLVDEDSPDRIEVSIYIDSNDRRIQAAITESVDELIETIGYHDHEDLEVVEGSIFRRSWVRVRSILGSDDVKKRLVYAERALELMHVELPQSEVDLRASQAVSNVIMSLHSVDRACVRVGSILILKYICPAGPVILTRTLTQLEIRALQSFPEIQSRPEDVINWLGSAIAAIDDSSGTVPPTP